MRLGQSQLAALKLFCIQNLEEIAAETFGAGSPGLLVFIGVWSFFSENTQTFKGNICICNDVSMECLLYTSQLEMIFCSMFDQVKGICQLYKSV